MDLIEGRQPNPQHLKWLEKPLRLDFGWTESGGSWNHWHILVAAELWLREDPLVADRILMYLEAQLGDPKAGAVPTNYPNLRFFGGTEQNSNTYEGWRWGFVLAVRLWALRHHDHSATPELLRLTARYSEVQTALLALGAAPGPTRYGVVLQPDTPVRLSFPHTNRRGQLWWHGPSLPMAGARSTPAHLGTDERMPLYQWHAEGRWIDEPDKRFGWPWMVAHHLRRAETMPFYVEAALDPAPALTGIRLLVPHHFLRWREEGVRANYMEKLVNGNTTSILGHVHYDHEDRAVYLFPWPGKLRGGLGEATCWVPAVIDGGWSAGVRMIARSRFGEVSVELPSRPPDSHVVMGPDGLEVLA